FMRTQLILGLLCALVGVSVHAQTLQRLPASLDFEQLTANVDKACNECISLLSTRAPPGSAPLLIVRGKQIGDAKGGKGTLQGVYFLPSPESASGVSGHDFVQEDIPLSTLLNTSNEDKKTVDAFEGMLKRPSLAQDATILVPKGAHVDASLLVRA